MVRKLPKVTPLGQKFIEICSNLLRMIGSNPPLFLRFANISEMKTHRNFCPLFCTPNDEEQRPMRRTWQVSKRCAWVVLPALWAVGCASVTVSSADFALQASPASASIAAGSSAQAITLTATAVSGFTGSVSVAISGLPSGVTASPSSLTLTLGTPQQVSLTASSSAAATTATVVFTGSSGFRTHTASVALTVTAASTTPTPPTPPTPPPPSSGSVDITTYHVDVARTGLNPNETTLTTSNVTSAQFGLIRTLAVDGHVDAQPLYLSGLTIAGQSHNVVYVATEHDSVYAFDADTGTQLWKTSVLGSGETTSDDHGCGQITPEIGITSTPVIDRKAGGEWDDLCRRDDRRIPRVTTTNVCTRST